ncbi:G-protein coupled receptor 143-like [Daphnia pulicaria]|uniref:G-protein coupled receptor 143-like n=1 Tax=Daphnia pulicaria TaxID=35523 RepID=UPI001EEA6CB0|nr:G-protein coupled receptor 143-like [Daphnia pulicaria]XP_046635274.1 G-protein coupled receptor 143-like [Daphnia pulicaria]XP_046635275.1 G-protein coupled receptor 143-like [Daphnia pulicaria]
MADPSLQSLCCLTTSNRSQQYQLLELHQSAYYGLSLASAIVGFLGAVYQLNLRYAAPFPRYQYFNVGLRGNNILFWLALADTFAAFGLTVRSTGWFLSQNYWSVHSSNLPHSPMNPLFCAIISGWIQFSYTSSHLWTLVYAIDVRRITFDQPFAAPVYHVCAWGGAVALCTTGLTLLYLPGHDSDAFIMLLPNHVTTYFPLVLTCLACPFLFMSAFRQAEISLTRRYARYTTTERRLVDSLKVKFILIVSVFYLCWMPNIVNGLVLWISWNKLPVTWVLANWYLMALLNPLQGVFNIMLYRIPKRRQPRSQLQGWFASLQIRKIEPQEETPLLL